MKARFRFLPAVALLTASLAMSQNSPHVSGVEPASGKVNSSITVLGENLNEDTIVGVFLSDEATDYPAEVVEKTADKIVLRVPDVKPGSYNISIQIGNNILIEPVRFTVEE